MSATALYAALLALMFLVLSVRTIRLRQELRVAVGDGGNSELQRAARAHGNFAEYVPLALLLIYFLELGASSLVVVHVLGGALVLGRIVHAYGLSRVEEDLRFRITGMVLTLGVIASAALGVLATAVGLTGA